MPEIDFSDPQFQSLAGIVLLAFVGVSKFWPQLKSWFGGVKGKVGDVSANWSGGQVGSDMDAPAGTQKYLESVAKAAPDAGCDFWWGLASSGKTISQVKSAYIEALRAKLHPTKGSPEKDKSESSE